MAAFFWLFRKPADLAAAGFPERSCSRIFLPAAGNEVLHRQEKCGRDGLPAQVEVEYANGNFELGKLRPDHTYQQSVEYYPGQGRLDTRKVRSRATFDKDGSTYLTHQVYRLDGTLERSGRGQRDGGYESRYYYADGKTPSRIRQFWDKRFSSEKRYREDGTLFASVLVHDKEVSIDLYSPGEVRIAALVRGPLGMLGGDVFSEDGNTVLASFIRDYWNFEEHYFDAKGKRRQIRTGQPMFGNVGAFVFDKDDKVVYTQMFRKRPKHGDVPAQTILIRVTEYDQTEKITRIIEMNNDGTAAKSLVEPAQDGRIVSELSDDGERILKRTHYDRANHVIKTESGRRFKRPTIKKERLQELPHIELPTYSDNEAPRYVYDYR